MHFLILRKADATTEAGAPPSAELLAATREYIEAMAQAGVLLGAEGLQPSSLGARVHFRDGVAEVVEGPFPDPGGLIAGYFVIEVASKSDAIGWARRWPAVDGDGTVDLEIRQLFTAEDFGDEFADEREREAAR